MSFKSVELFKQILLSKHLNQFVLNAAVKICLLKSIGKIKIKIEPKHNACQINRLIKSRSQNREGSNTTLVKRLTGAHLLGFNFKKVYSKKLKFE